MAGMVAAVVGFGLAVGTVAVAKSEFGAIGAKRQAGADCPRRVQPLPANALAPASSAALDSQLSRYEELGTRPLVTRAALAEFDEARGPGARRDCGRRVERRTVVVYLESASRSFRHRSPSLSQGVVFVSRFVAIATAGGGSSASAVSRMQASAPLAAVAAALTLAVAAAPSGARS
jgi:hypothetical protein